MVHEHCTTCNSRVVHKRLSNKNNQQDKKEKVEATDRVAQVSQGGPRTDEEPTAQGQIGDVGTERKCMNYTSVQPLWNGERNTVTKLARDISVVSTVF